MKLLKKHKEKQLTKWASKLQEIIAKRKCYDNIEKISVTLESIDKTLKSMKTR